jgi:DNA-binding HxlR family transcriptional regulator
MLEDVLGCKWTVQILMQVRSGVCRPGALERLLDGLTTKVLNERLAKLVRFGILDRLAFPEVPPRVEYVLTPFGTRFAALLDEVENLSRDFQATIK